MNQPDRGAWQLLADTYGKTIAHALQSGHNIHFVAKNGDKFEIGQGRTEPSGVFLVNLTQNKKYCIQMSCVYQDQWKHSDYPVADRLFYVLELLRTSPGEVERVAVKWTPRGLDMAPSIGIRLGQQLVNSMSLEDNRLSITINEDIIAGGLALLL